MANETLLKLRCGSDQYKSVDLAAPSPGVTAGLLTVLATGLVGMYVDTKATGELVAFIYKADKVIVPKDTGAGISQGAKVYYGTGNKVYASSATNRRYCGICTVAAAQADTEVEIELDGVLGITAQTS